MSREQRLEAALQEAQQCLYRDGANAAGEVKALIDAVLGEQEAPEPEPPSVAEVLIRSLNEAIDACAAVFRDTAEHGPAQALENLADFLNAKDAVGDDDPEWYERAQARLAASAPQGEPEPGDGS